MGRRFALIYDLLRSAEQQDGLSPKEILDQVSEIHKIPPGKALKKQINVALRRGIDFGILTKQNNKYRFQLKALQAPNDDEVEEKKGKKKGRKKKGRKKGKSESKPPTKRVSSRKQAQEPPPRPRVPPPPNWMSKRRNLREEPMPKFIRHPQGSNYPKQC